MPSYTTNDFRSGQKVLLDGEPYNIVDVEFVKPGKGQAFARVKVRNLLSGRVTERTYKTGESIEAADVLETDMQYLYSDGSHWFFMHPVTYEQHEVSQEGVGDAADFLKEQETVSVILWNNRPISVQPPNHVVLRIVETDPGIRGDTATGGTKPAKLETGAVVKVPLFVEEGELIKVDTRSREYLSRAKE